MGYGMSLQVVNGLASESMNNERSANVPLAACRSLNGLADRLCSWDRRPDPAAKTTKLRQSPDTVDDRNPA